MNFRIGIFALLATATPFSPALASAPRNACGLAHKVGRQDLVHVPFKTVDGRIYVEAKVNDRGPYIFALDTGASGLGRADSALTNALNLPLGDDRQNSDGVQQSAAKTVRIDALQIGGLRRDNLQLISRNYRSGLAPEATFAGILGRDFFGDGLLVIDYGQKTISFTRKRTLDPGLKGALRYERAFRVPVTIAGIATTGNLDTGANVELILPLSFYRRISTDPLEQNETGRMTNSSIRTGRATVSGPVSLGSVSASHLSVKVSDQFPEVLVGAHFLQRSILLIDQRTQTVAVCPRKMQITAN